MSRIATLILFCAFLPSAVPARADVIAVFFAGFSFPAVDPATTGMNDLNVYLNDRFINEVPEVSYSGKAFSYNDRDGALEFIESFSTIDTLFVLGHSFGGHAALQLASIELDAIGMTVDRTFQIDSVDIFLPPQSDTDDILPENVNIGFNYYQVANADLQGEMDVAGAININVEELFNDTSITHTSIDNDERLYNEIFDRMVVAVPEPSMVTAILIGSTLMLRRKRRD